jgi:hypothetical protein
MGQISAIISYHVTITYDTRRVEDPELGAVQEGDEVGPKVGCFGGCFGGDGGGGVLPSLGPVLWEC